MQSETAERLAGHVALVTGSTGLGLGTEIARVFAAAGASVVVTGRNEARGAHVVEEITEAGGIASFVAADLSHDDAADALVESTVDRHGELTVLVNSAVATIQRHDAGVADLDLAIWHEAMLVNVTGPMLLCRAAIPSMLRAGRGAIVNIGSRAAIRATPQLAAYSASKGALHALTRSIAIDYAAAGIRCNTVSPGFIVGKDRDDDLGPDRRTWVEAMHLTPPPTTTEVALATLYLASDESRSITGTELLVDGGGSMARGLTLG